MYGWIIHRIWGRWMEFGVAGVGKQMGGWARIGTKVWRWMVIGIKGLWAQSDRMLSIGDGWTHVRVLKVCPKKEKCEWSGSESGSNCQMGGQMESRVAGVGRWIGGWAGDGTQVRRWVVIGIMGLWAQSDGMLSLGDEWNMYGVCPKKEICGQT